MRLLSSVQPRCLFVVTVTVVMLLFKVYTVGLPNIKCNSMIVIKKLFLVLQIRFILC